MNSKMKIIGAILIVGAIVFFVFFRDIFSKPQPSKTTEQETIQTQDESPRIVSTKPDPLNDIIIPATEIIEIAFNRSIENVGEFKLRMEPEIEYKIELSGDRKTAKIIPVKPYQLGKSYTIFIGSETKFDGVGRWGQEKEFHFRTIKYNGV